VMCGGDGVRRQTFDLVVNVHEQRHRPNIRRRCKWDIGGITYLAQE